MSTELLTPFQKKDWLKFILQITGSVLILFLVIFILWWAIEKIATQQKAQQFRTKAEAAFLPEFQHAGISYPPNQLALLVFKDSKKIEIYARNNQPWKYIKTFPILAASGHAGPKLQEGDLQVPEGIYQITWLNPFSNYTLSMEINYPNQFDQMHGALDHRHHLGGEIFIHGSDLSIGCIAIGDEGIEQLFPLVYQVGINNVTVIIAPNDLRLNNPVMYPDERPWITDLYREIKAVLMTFPYV